MRPHIWLVIALTATSAAAQAPVDFLMTYRGGSAELQCNTNYSIKGFEPAVAGDYPVFLYMVGTGEVYDTPTAMAVVESMARRDYVAATVQYPNATMAGCGILRGRAGCMFNPAVASSAISTICSRPNADCTKGIVVAGLDQGAVMAILSRNSDDRVRAAYGLGVGSMYTYMEIGDCVTPGYRTLPSDRLRVVNGEVDATLGRTAGGVRMMSNELTGLSCPAPSMICFRPNGSGWYIVSGNETNDGQADHCYHRVGGCGGHPNALDSTWWLGVQTWSLEINLNWLDGFTDH